MMKLTDMNISSRVADLISGYLFDELNKNELIELGQWINASSENRAIFESVLDASSLERQGFVYTSTNVSSALMEAKKQMKFVKKKKTSAERKMKLIWSRILVAASVLLICTAGAHYYLSGSHTSQSFSGPAEQTEINPGINSATLTLANGKKIVLSSAIKGKLANEAGVTITKASDGMIVYEIKTQNGSNNHQMNTLSTAKGEQYQVKLPDGTLVWLNAATSLKYPSSFVLAKERKVELSGEAYFEVAKDSDHPFIVSTPQQTLKVLGTHFNISSYSDEEVVKTTLLEGSVKINDKVLLKPGQESQLAKSGTVDINYVDTENAVAWKNGFFAFDNETLKTAMNKIGRWYDAEIQFQNPELEALTVGGSISRFDKVSKILSLFEKAGNIQFIVKGRKILIAGKPEVLSKSLVN